LARLTGRKTAWLVATIMFWAGMNLAWAEEPDWTNYAMLLERHVSPGSIDGTGVNLVSYPSIKADPLFSKITQQLAQYPQENLSNHEERLAFYINAYNILAIKMVTDHWPLKSIKDAGSLFTAVWDKPAGVLSGHTVTLGEIEHEILRPMGDPRIHMAIVCASISCPDLSRSVYRATTIGHQLDTQTRHFLDNKGKGLRIEANDIRVSRIFDWFEDDFAAQGGVMKFISQYRKSLPSSSPIKANLPYNWQLNYRDDS